MPESNEWFHGAFHGTRLMAILRGLSVQRSLELAERAWDVGVVLVEIPLQTTDDEDAMRAVVAAADRRGAIVGAGTIIRREQIDVAARLGARFTVSPGFSPEIVRASHAVGMPSLPGVATGSEIQAALNMGLTWLKAFPATALGPDWIRAMLGPFPQACFVATGGIDASNAGEFLDAGCAAAAIGSALADPAQLDRLRTVRGGVQ